MSNSYNSKENLTHHISEMIERLNSKQVISKEACEQVEQEIKDLNEVRCKKLRERAMSNKLDVLLNEFCDSAEASKQLLNSVLETVTGGKIPDIDTVKELNSKIETLRDRYETIQLFADEVLPAEELPTDGVSVFDYADAINNSKAFMYKKQLQEIQALLEKFITVRGLLEQYEIALAPFQEKAKSMLSELSNDTIDVESAIEESDDAALFMEALEYDNLTTDSKGLELLQQISQKMNFTVQAGLASNKYALGDSDDKVDLSESKDNTNSDEINNADNQPSVVKNEETEDVQIDVEMEDKVQGESQAEEEQPAPNAESDLTEIDVPIEIEETEFVRVIKERNLILQSNACFGKMAEDISLNEEKKLSATIFTNDLRKGNVKVAVNIIKVLCRNGSMTEDALAEEIHISKDLLSLTLSQLMKKGYIRKYSIKYGEIFAPSPRLQEALSYKSASSFADVKQNCLSDYENVKPGEENLVAAFIAYSNLLQKIEKEPGTKTTSSIIHMRNGGFAVQLYHDENPEHSTLLMGEFWNNTDTCDLFTNCLEEQLATCNKKAKQIIVAALDVGRAMSFAEILIDKFELNDYGAIISVYGLSEDELKAINEQQFEVSITGESSANREEKIIEEKPESIVASSDTIESEKVKSDSTVEDMLADGLFYAAIAFAKADANKNAEKKTLYNQLRYAFNEPSDNCNYSSTNLYSLISDGNDLENSLVLSAAIRTFFSNQVKYDYDIKSVYGALNDNTLLEVIPRLRQLIYDMSEFKSSYNTGLDFYADYHKRDQKELDAEIASLRKEATDFYNKNVVGVIKEKTGHKRFLETTKLIFSANSELGEYLKLVVDGETDTKDLIADFLGNTFYAPESVITETTIDEGLLWGYIQDFWDKAGQKMSFYKRDDLKSHLRNNITSKTTKAVQLLAKWCNLSEMLIEHDEDEGSIAYKKLKKSLLENISGAVNALETEEKDPSNSTSLIAGMKVLKNTLSEIQACIDGSFDERTRRFFYIDFLLTDDLMLDELYLPDIDTHTSTLEELSVQTRIIRHIDKIKTKKPSFKSRLTDILEEQGDDLGAAKLIIDYLSISDPDNSYADYIAEINDSTAYAKETAELRKADFIGELELAQSYGQIDNSTEDQKEIILKAVDEWFEWADASANYGFFKKVIDNYMSDIRRNAKNREADILEELDAFKNSTISDLSIDEKEKKIAKVLAAVKEQNYTVAEDILSRDDLEESGADALIEEDFLKDFLENYDDFYQPVATKNASLANLVKNRTRNKEERGAKRLADNWLPGGSRIGKPRLEILLKNLGFDVRNVTEQNTIGRFEEYRVVTGGAFKRQRNSYTHPIAALGSGASEAGFRVVCLNGAYDADNLIDLMKQIGNAKHTLILLDYALSMGERRRLARKTKSTLGDKLFAVIDRTVMMYLIRNYDETKINRMLVSLITPFAYYQPYVWESANIMPPEIFMGRKLELEKIKSPTGVNIVYGGRQLGKSALLKKAKEDIDWNENGDRAVYIDIKGLDYKETARKIGHELVDQFILKEDIDTDNWDELARAVRRRLQNNEDKIPYLLLLLDEADAFIESCSAINYKPFDSLKEIQGVGSGRFKFVVAGLRDIVRFKRDALANNSVLTHLEPMTVTPFKFSEARELMEIPLHYLGLRFPKDKESLITLIMATTNYFPGLIQLYCAKLIEAMRNKDYAGYDEVDSPIYDVNEEHIKKVLSDPDFMQQIREKYIITLKLDEDNYYHLIALIMAWLYHNEGGKTGYSAEDIKNIGTEYGIKKLAELDIAKLENFCEELKELNVLRKTEEHRYLFTRFNFFQMMGTADEVDSALLEYMEA